MNNHESIARKLKSEGNNCSFSVYNAFKDLDLSIDFPAPRSIDGKCGALLTSLKILKEKGFENKIEEFEEWFIYEFGYNKCVDLMTHERRCNDYVGMCSKKLDEILNI